MIIVRLRTGHCRLRDHMFAKFIIGLSVMCPRDTRNFRHRLGLLTQQ